MAAKPLTAAAAIMVATNNRNNAPSPAPTPTSKHLVAGASQLTELEHETPIESIKIDSLAVMKIIKHARECAASGSTSPASGQLLGLDAAGVLNVSDAFSLPSGSLVGPGDGEETRGTKIAFRYTSSILPRLSALGADANIVGFYCSTINSQHLATPGFIETLISIQIGTSLPDPKLNPKPSTTTATNTNKPKTLAGGKGLAIVYDLASSTQGTVQLKAFRLSDKFVEAYRSGKLDSQNLADHTLTMTNILQEIPLVIQSSALLTAFLATLLAPGCPTPLDPFLPSFSPLGLPSTAHPDSPAPISDTLSAVISAIETHNTALSTLSFQSRQLARDRARLEAVITKRKNENDARTLQGLPLLGPSAEEAALQEPSRLETMCALSGVDGAAKKLTEISGLGVVRAFGAKAGV